MGTHDPLLQPFQLKHLTLKNRILSTAHEPAYSEAGMPGERYRLYHREKAKGGIAMTMTAGSAVVSPDSPAAFGNLLAYKDEIVAPLKALADDCHAYGCAVMIQITHLGRRTNWDHSDWLPVLAPSPVREPAHRAFPKAAEDWDLDRIVDDYAATAQRMQAADLDGIEIEAYGHLLDQFWSPVTNKRDDDYGGSLDNRLRFTWRVLTAIRDKVGPDFIVGLRMVADEDWEKGLSKEEGIEIAHRLKASGQVDFLNIIRGHIDHDAALANVIPIQGTPAAPHLDFAGAIRAETKIPVFHAARINDVATARHAVATGKLDMVGMTRAHMADPHIIKKIMEGREEDIQPCVGASFCIDRLYVGHEALCVHNAATGREAQIPHEIPKAESGPKHIVVVGAGPAGLEAARVACERGHRVTVLEAAPHAGGQVRLAARTPRRTELIGIIDWRLAQIERLGADIRYNFYADAQDILALDPHIVVIATGGLPNIEVLEEGSTLCVSSWDILSGDVKPGENVLVFDDNGGHPANQAAEFLARAGSKVEIVTPERMFAPEMGGLNHQAYAGIFQDFDVRLTIHTRLIKVEKSGNGLLATLGSDYSNAAQQRVIDQVVIEHGTVPLDDLYFALKPLSSNLGAIDMDALLQAKPQHLVNNIDGIFQLFRIGDAVSSRSIHAAVYDALRLCKDM